MLVVFSVSPLLRASTVGLFEKYHLTIKEAPQKILSMTDGGHCFAIRVQQCLLNDIIIGKV